MPVVRHKERKTVVEIGGQKIPLHYEILPREKGQAPFIMVEHNDQLSALDERNEDVASPLDAHFKKLHPKLGEDLMVGVRGPPSKKTRERR